MSSLSGSFRFVEIEIPHPQSGVSRQGNPSFYFEPLRPANKRLSLPLALKPRVPLLVIAWKYLLKPLSLVAAGGGDAGGLRQREEVTKWAPADG
jgi:hypothetical protein